MDRISARKFVERIYGNPKPSILMDMLNIDRKNESY